MPRNAILSDKDPCNSPPIGETVPVPSQGFGRRVLKTDNPPEQHCAILGTVCPQEPHLALVSQLRRPQLRGKRLEAQQRSSDVERRVEEVGQVVPGTIARPWERLLEPRLPKEGGAILDARLLWLHRVNVPFFSQVASSSQWVLSAFQ